MIAGRDTQVKKVRIWLSAIVLAWGLQVIVAQSILLREAIVLMSGSEFAWGIVLFSWLLGVAAGAYVGGWRAKRSQCPELTLATILFVLTLITCVELWLFRGARAWLGVEPGALLPLTKTALAALVLVTPVSLLVGMAFPFACCVVHQGNKANTQVNVLTFGQVYALESAGSLIGGAGFSFWAVENLSPIQTILACGCLTAFAIAGLVIHHRRRFIPVLAVSFVIVLSISTFLLAGPLNRKLILRRWDNIAAGYKLVAETESKYQNLAVGHRAGQYTLYCDGQVTVDFPDPYAFAPLAHFWLCQHPNPKTILVIGGGAEGLLSEILLHPVEHVDYLEPDSRQIELLKPYLPPADQRALGDYRVTVHHADARYFIKTKDSAYDLVVARLPEPTSAHRARFYTREFFAELRKAMKPESVLCLTATASPGELSPSSLEYLASIQKTLRLYFPYITIGWGNPAQVLAATGPNLTTADPAEMSARYSRREVQSKTFHPAWFEGATDWLDAEKINQRRAEIDSAKRYTMSTDLWPEIYIQRLAYWESISSESKIIAQIRSIGFIQLVLLLAGAGLFTLFADKLRHKGPTGWANTSITLSVAGTGFVTMAMSLIWLFSFQTLYGYVYQRIGWIIALFMGGLVVGCLLASRQQTGSQRGVDIRRLWHRMITVDLALAVLAFSAPLVLPALASLQASQSALAAVEWCISLMVALTGFLGGRAFAVSAQLQLHLSGEIAHASAAIVGADHAGACAGALFCGVLLIPVFGIVSTCIILAIIKLATALILCCGSRFDNAMHFQA